LKVAPCLVRGHDGYVRLGGRFFASERDARDKLGEDFVRWLGGTPYEIDVILRPDPDKLTYSGMIQLWSDGVITVGTKKRAKPGYAKLLEKRVIEWDLK
jgi:hypothetical protein